MRTLRCRIKSYIQPFERVLALRELDVIATPHNGVQLVPGVDFEYEVDTPHPASVIASKLAYWETVAATDAQLTTTQSWRESTVNVIRNGIEPASLRAVLPFKSSAPLPNRRCLRYGPHGIHEYRGRFFPQLVRALINVSATNPGGIVADPMCGSGTTAVEAALYGCKGLGLDMNPLSIFVARTKCELLSADVQQLEAAYARVRDAILEPAARGSDRPGYSTTLPASDRKYLGDWFAPEVLAGLDEIVHVIQAVEYPPARNLMWVSLSNIVRSVSWQKEADLRVRKEVRLDVEIDPKKEFLEELARSIRAILAFLYQSGPLQGSQREISEADARHCAKVWANLRGAVDVVITSPPYATALPYLDTDRLSLCYLGLLPRPEHRRRDERMIGNREITERLRRSYWERFEIHEGELPASVRQLIRSIAELNDGTDHGFRRRNLPALLANYFFDMREVLAGIRDVLKEHGQAYVVVGNNHTIAGGQRVEIKTANFLSEIAGSVGLTLSESLSMEMLVSRDIFRKNTLGSEEILVFRKTNQR